MFRRVHTRACLPIVSYADVVAGWGIGVPGDVEPAGACEQLVGVRVCPEERYEQVELLGVLRSDVGCLAGEMLRVLDTADLPIDLGVPEARVDDDGPHVLPGRFQQVEASVGQVGDVAHRWDVPRVFLQVEKLAQAEVRRELHVLNVPDHGSSSPFLFCSFRAMNLMYWSSPKMEPASRNDCAT